MNHSLSRPIIALVVATSVGILALVLGAVQTEPPLATLGQEVLRESDFRQYLTLVQPPEQLEAIGREPELRAKALEEYLDSKAIAEKARRVGLEKDERFQKAVELMEMKNLAQLVSERHRDSILKNSAVSTSELREYYEQHKHELTVEPRFTAHHLLIYVKGNPAFPDQGLADVAARAKAAEALAKLRAGNGWQEVAAKYSDDVATRQSSGLLRDRQFGYFAPEVEQALRTQDLGKPGAVIKTMFGYYVIEVKERVTEKTPKPFDEVSEVLTERLSQQRLGEARLAFMNPIWKEVGFKLTEAGIREASLSDENAVASNEVLADVAGRRVTESDFRWFCRDAFLPSQRMSAFSRPGARQGMLSSFLDMLVLQAKAKRDGLDRGDEYLRGRATLKERLLREFLQERDKQSPVHKGWTSEQERRLAEREYLDHVRAEVGLKVVEARK